MCIKNKGSILMSGERTHRVVVEMNKSNYQSSSSSSSSSKIAKWFKQSRPYLAVIFLQGGFAGMSILTKSALNKGMSPHVLAVYRHVVAAAFISPLALIFERNSRPRMTLSIFLKIALLGLLEPTIDQNLVYAGMKLTTAAFTSAMCNVLPAFAFLMAWLFRLEKVKLRRLHSQAKVLGTLVTVGGAMFMTLVKGPVLNLPWANGHGHHGASINLIHKQEPVKGALMITAGCFCWAGFIILQAVTLKSYPAELSLTALICLMGAMEGAVVALGFEWGHAAAWSIKLDVKLAAAVYSGILCSGLAYYVQGVIMKTRGPVFVTAFNPLSMVIVAVLGSFMLSEILYLGRVIGAVVIVVGLYLVLWGKTKDEPLVSDSKEQTMKVQELGMMTHKVGPTEEELVTVDVR